MGLLTLKGKNLIEQADVVVYDALVSASILSMIPSSAQAIFVGKRAGNHPVPQEQINQILLEQAMQGKRVVRLKGGDPFLFGRGGEELELLIENGIDYEVVPVLPRQLQFRHITVFQSPTATIAPRCISSPHTAKKAAS